MTKFTASCCVATNSSVWDQCTVEFADDAIIITVNQQLSYNFSIDTVSFSIVYISTPPLWESDARSCYVCLRQFTMITRRHHCRSCGRTTCHSCSSKSIVLPWHGHFTPVRVCDRCYDSTINRLLDTNLRPNPAFNIDLDYGSYTPSLVSSLMKHLKFGFCTPSDARKRRSTAIAVDEVFFTLPTTVSDAARDDDDYYDDHGDDDSTVNNHILAIKVENNEIWIQAHGRFDELIERVSACVPCDTMLKLPTKMSEWSVPQVCAWLESSVGLRSYSHRFQQHNINGLALTRVSLEDLSGTLGITSSLHRKKILRMRQLYFTQRLSAMYESKSMESSLTVVQRPPTTQPQHQQRKSDGYAVMKLWDPCNTVKHATSPTDDVKGYRTRVDSSFTLSGENTFTSFKVGETVAYFDHDCRAYKIGKVTGSSSSSSSSTANNDGGNGDSTEYSVDVNGSVMPVKSNDLLKCRQMKMTWKKGTLIGSGGFGTVWTAYPVGARQNPTTIIAVKQMNLRIDDDIDAQIARITPEISLMQMLDHPNIVKFLGSEIDRERARVYIFMEYVHGGSLKKLLQNFGGLPEFVVAKYCKQMLTGLHYLHRNRIVHRDLKASNVLVDNDGRVRLADFGGSTQIQEICHSGNKKRVVKTNLMTLVGSPYFMAPEVVRQDGYGRSADIWSLGCTIIELLTGHPPWREYNQIAAVYTIGNTDKTPELPTNVSPACRDFIHSCLRRTPSERPTACELLESAWLTSDRAMSPHIDTTPQQFAMNDPQRPRDGNASPVQWPQHHRSPSKLCLEIHQPTLVVDKDDGAFVQPSIAEEYDNITIETSFGAALDSDRSVTPSIKKRPHHKSRQRSRDDLVL